MDQVISFFSHPFFILFSGMSTVIVIVTMLYSIVLVSKGVFPVLWRLGYGLSKRKIAVFADGRFDDLKAMLVDSRLFREKNILRIDKGSIKKARDISLLLVHWQVSKDFFEEILAMINDGDALIIYAPQNEGRIDDAGRDAINRNRNAIIVNFRGRLLNDVLTSMITTGYRQK
ncbi:MAG: hypothetical protein MI684_07535 [Chlorobiales bacterium]|nr:hypothetical protein [Chlorobiales bacterium]